MPVEYENTISGSTDISGTPDPVRTPGKAASDQRKQQNQNERRPGKGSQQPESPAQQPPTGDVGGAIGKGIDTAGNWLHQQGFAQPTQSLNPVDWAEEYKQDASVPWGWARNAYKTLSGEYNDGVAGLFASNDAVAKVGQQASAFL